MLYEETFLTQCLVGIKSVQNYQKQYIETLYFRQQSGP